MEEKTKYLVCIMNKDAYQNGIEVTTKYMFDYIYDALNFAKIVLEHSNNTVVTFEKANGRIKYEHRKKRN